METINEIGASDIQELEEVPEVDIPATVKESNEEVVIEAQKTTIGFNFDLDDLAKEIELDEALKEKEVIPVTEDHSCAVPEVIEENADILSEKNLEVVWSKLMDWFMSNEQKNLHELLLDKQPTIMEKSLNLTLDSEVEKEIIVNNIGQIKGFLKRHFTDFVELNLEVSKSVKSKKIILNQKDKFIILAKKNPWLNELRKELGLELEM